MVVVAVVAKRVVPVSLVERPPVHAEPGCRRRGPLLARRRPCDRSTSCARACSSGWVAPGEPAAAVIHDGTIRCHTRQLPRQSLTQVVNRHDRASPSFDARRAREAAGSARGCTARHEPAGSGRGRPGGGSDTVRQRARVPSRTRRVACLKLTWGLQDRCAVPGTGGNGVQERRATGRGTEANEGNGEELQTGGTEEQKTNGGGRVLKDLRSSVCSAAL
jgi:hypothetical protein